VGGVAGEGVPRGRGSRGGGCGRWGPQGAGGFGRGGWVGGRGAGVGGGGGGKKAGMAGGGGAGRFWGGGSFFHPPFLFLLSSLTPLLPLSSARVGGKGCGGGSRGLVWGAQGGGGRGLAWVGGVGRGDGGGGALGGEGWGGGGGGGGGGPGVGGGRGGGGGSEGQATTPVVPGSKPGGKAEKPTARRGSRIWWVEAPTCGRQRHGDGDENAGCSLNRPRSPTGREARQELRRITSSAWSSGFAGHHRADVFKPKAEVWRGPYGCPARGWRRCRGWQCTSMDLMEGGMAEPIMRGGVSKRIVWEKRDRRAEWVDGSTFKMAFFPLNRVRRNGCSSVTSRGWTA